MEPKITFKVAHAVDNEGASFPEASLGRSDGEWKPEEDASFAESGSSVDHDSSSGNESSASSEDGNSSSSSSSSFSSTSSSRVEVLPKKKAVPGKGTKWPITTPKQSAMPDKVAAAWVKAVVRCTLEKEALAHRRYRETGLSLEKGGCVGDPHVVAERCLVFVCILHCCMAMGRLQVAFIEARLGDLPKDNAVAVQRVLYRARSGHRLGASASPDGEEAQAFFLTWEELGPL